MGSRTEIPPLAGPYGAMLGQKYDPIYADFPGEGTTTAPEVHPGRAFKDPFLGIQATDKFVIGGEFERLERVETFSQQQRMALSLLSSSRFATAIDFGQEPMAVREQYGMTLFGQSLLAARRLVEAGTRFVTVFWDAVGLNAGSWDTHHNHYGRLKHFLLPIFDHAFSGLILDLDQRGLLDETLVLVLSEHGRTPQIDSKPKGAGRHHWSRAYSQVYAGGGMARGKVVGKTDRHAGDVDETPISPKDILATAFHLLGIDPDSTVPDSEGRPIPITGTGVVRPELF
jgi:hypothetical protein